MTNHEAVEVLKQEIKCVSSVDCERAECRNCVLVLPEHEVLKALYRAIGALENPIVGRWVKSNLDFSQADDFWECSMCGWEIYDHRAKTNYCPSCGAKMEEQSNG